MDFAWTPERLAFRRAVVEFARRALQDDLVRRDQTGEVSREGERPRTATDTMDGQTLKAER